MRQRASSGQELAAGDVVRTADDPSTLAEVVHRNGAVTRLDRQSEITVDRDDTTRPRIVVTLGPGRTWHNTGPLDDPTLYEVRCPGAVLTARYARFALLCADDGSTVVDAADGNVVVRGAVGGSVALGDGQSARVDPAGVVAGTGTADPADPWIALNRSLDLPGRPTPTVEVIEEAAVEAVVEEAVDGPAPAPAGRPRWATRVGAGLAVAAFLAVLAFTFATADRGGPPPGRAAALLQATKDQGRPEPVPESESVAAEQAAAAAASAATPSTVPAPPPATATATGASCRQSGRTIVYSGTVRNTSSTASAFTVDAVFLTASRSRFASASATTGTVAPGRSASWTVRVPTTTDLRNSGASCEVAGVRPAPAPTP